MSVAHRIAFALELLLADLIFLAPLPKKGRFWVRYPLAVLAVIGASYFCVLKWDFLTVTIAKLIRMVIVYGISIWAMCWCFDRKPMIIVSACAAGYAVEHITFQLVKILGLSGAVVLPDLWGIPQWELLEYVFFLPIYLIFGLTLGTYANRHNCFQHPDNRLTIPFVTIFAVTIGLTRVADALGENDTVTVSVYAIACCFIALAFQLVMQDAIRLQHERNTIQLLWQEDQRQYELSKKTIDIINVKHHDLKKKLNQIQTAISSEDMRSVEEAVAVYDRCFRTGNEALDVLLTQSSLIGQEEGITISYTGNGADLSFMSTMDVYSLFGNALDNAIEAVRRIPQKEQRIIDIVTEKKGSLILIVIKNYFVGQLVMENGSPVTTKTEEEGFHGFGIKSMRMIAEKYNGNVTARQDGELFVLTANLFDPQA